MTGWAQSVTKDGQLDDAAIFGRETLYKGMNGREVERFYTSDGTSYIFKPLTNPKQFGRECWIYEEILPNLSVYSPRLVDASYEADPEHSWLILEDLGVVFHSFQEPILSEMTAHCANWHHFSIEETSKLSPQGPKPFIENIMETLLSEKARLIRIGCSNTNLRLAIERTLELALHFTFGTQKVFSHGDLHLGNFGWANDKVVVFDWEYAHFNLPYWDLYHLIDLSHPDFPKQVTRDLREHLLNVYISEVERHGTRLDPMLFRREYAAFSSLFSVWMLLLIEKDLTTKSVKWSQSQLITQREDTISSLIQCTEMTITKKSP